MKKYWSKTITKAPQPALAVLSFCLNAAISSLFMAVPLYSSLALGDDSANIAEFKVLDSPVTKLKTNRVFGWRVDVSNATGEKASANTADTTLTQHNKLSVLAHAKHVSSEKITSTQYSSKKDITNASFRLVGNLPSTIEEAADTQQNIAILPEVNRIRYQLSVSSTITPTDSCFQFQPELHSLQSSTYKSSSNLTGAWDLYKGQGDPNIAIAVLDSGIVSHTDQDSTRIILGGTQDFITSPTQSSDGDGRDKDPSDPGVSDTCSFSRYHGTHVAGTVGANSNNSNGITGVNWLSKIVPIRVLGPSDGSTGDIVDAVLWAQTSPKIKVLNMSFGLSNIRCDQAFFWRPDFLGEAFERNILSVVASGNNHSDAADFSPANCDASLSVAATNKQGRKAYYSNYGPDIDISAPGGEIGKNGNKQHGILSTVNANRYEYMQGTSMATPIVAGTASLVFSRNPNITAAEVKNILKATATPFQAIGSHGLTCDTEICGAGILNAEAAVQHATDVEPPILFFPRQIQHAVINRSVNVDVLLSKKANASSTFNVLISSPSCTPQTTSYQGTISKGSLKHSFSLKENNCKELNLELKGTENAPFTIPIKNGKNTNKISFIDTANIQTETNFEEIHWNYLEPSSQGNIHTVFLKEPNNYFISIISDMNTELIITNGQSETLFDSQLQDPTDSNKLDYWLKYSLTRAQLLRFTVKERSPEQGGMYAVSLTTAPDFSGEVASYCQVPLGYEKKKCSPSNKYGEQEAKQSTEIHYDKVSSINIYFLIAMFLLMLFALAIRLHSLRLN